MCNKCILEQCSAVYVMLSWSQASELTKLKGISKKITAQTEACASNNPTSDFPFKNQLNEDFRDPEWVVPH